MASVPDLRTVATYPEEELSQAVSMNANVQSQHIHFLVNMVNVAPYPTSDARLEQQQQHQQQRGTPYLYPMRLS